LGDAEVIDRIAIASILKLKLFVAESKVEIDYNFTLPDGSDEAKEAIMIFPTMGTDDVSDPEVKNA